jgi:ribosomal protein S6--L-glutamate ligase
MLRIGVVGTSGGWSSERLADVLQELTGYRLLVDMQEATLDLAAGRVWCRDVDLSSLDGLIVKKAGARYSPYLLQRLEVLNFLHQRGLPVFSQPLHIMRVLDRLSCTVALQLAGVPMPSTTITEDAERARQAVEAYGEAILKPLFTSKSRGMHLVRAGDPGLEETIGEFRQKNPIMYIQQKIEIQGRDLGVVFLGGEYLTTYARCNRNGSWSTATAKGGEYEPYTPGRECVEVARRAQAVFGLDFTSVDVVESDRGPLVFEVSAFGGFRGVLEAREIDAARLYAQYVIGKLRHR